MLGFDKSNRSNTFVNVFIILFALFYVYLYLFGGPNGTPTPTSIAGLARWWFNPFWATDDSYQQTFPFFKVLDPTLFANDIVTTLMEHYLTPLHNAVWVAITHLTKDPVMTGHWVMLIQLSLTLIFIYGAVYSRTSLFAAVFAVIWFLHARHLVQRMTGGLPRGWAAPLISGYFFFLLRGQYKSVLALIIIGCILHPMSAFLMALSYGLFLLVKFLPESSRSEFKKPFIALLVASPICIALTLWTIKGPPEIGKMVTYDIAAKMPEMNKDGGRFTFVPLTGLWREVKEFGFHAFLMRMYKVSSETRRNIPILVIAFTLFLAAFSFLKKRRDIFPAEIWTYLLAGCASYLLSRQFAFLLYVPDRHLQYPFGIFFIVTFSIALWRLGHKNLDKIKDASFSVAYLSLIYLFALSVLLYIGSGHGMYGSANFNAPKTQRGEYVNWLRENTAKDALIAGHPQFIDPVPLWSQRVAYITYETAHPWYDKYYETIKPRIEISLLAHYAKDLPEFYEIVSKQNIDYFVFERQRFYPEALKRAKFFRPYSDFLKVYTDRPLGDYAYRKISLDTDPQETPYVVYRDSQAVVVDVKKLGEWLSKK